MTDFSSSDCVEWVGARSADGYGQKHIDGKTMYVHRLAFTERHGRQPEGVVRHVCDNPACYNPDHLVEGTKKQNSEDMVERGRSSRGADRYNAVLGEDDVRAIREMFDSATNSEIAKLFGVTRQNVQAIRVGRSWRHVR